MFLQFVFLLHQGYKYWKLPPPPTLKYQPISLGRKMCRKKEEKTKDKGEN
jgi:hypothetical protein